MCPSQIGLVLRIDNNSQQRKAFKLVPVEMTPRCRDRRGRTPTEPCQRGASAPFPRYPAPPPPRPFSDPRGVPHPPPRTCSIHAVKGYGCLAQQPLVFSVHAPLWRHHSSWLDALVDGPSEGKATSSEAKSVSGRVRQDVDNSVANSTTTNTPRVHHTNGQSEAEDDIVAARLIKKHVTY